VRNDNYPSASEIVRNLAGINVPRVLLHTEGKFRVYQFESPFFQGGEFWIVSEKGFMWEPADSLEEAKVYLASEEAMKYQDE